ncbi:MAG: DUF975 family protein [Clostridia bacterium]|nr:DUF975 family protein [Clostridia bacterium]
MRFAADFRAIARAALRGKWLTAAFTSLTASLIGAQIASGGGGGSSADTEDSGFSLFESLDPQVVRIIEMMALLILVITAVTAILGFIIGGAGKLGYARFNLNLVDGREARIDDLFSQFHRLGAGFIMNLLTALYVFFWSLLFVIPGIIKTYSYAMTPYILSEHPEYTPNDAITLSRRMMDGNKFRLFCLRFSFIGWSILCSLPSAFAVTALLSGSMLLLPLVFVTILGYLFLYAYQEAAQAAFYREISGTEIQFTV